MDHVVYLDKKSKEFEYLKQKEKDIILRGATGRKLPYGRVNEGDVLYFTVNDGSQLISSKAIVKSTTFTEKLDQITSEAIVDELKDRIKLHPSTLKRFRGKRYLVVIEIKDFELIESFEFDKSDFSNMDDWLLVEEIERIIIK